MTDIGRELLRLLTERRSEWKLDDGWIDLDAPRIGLRTYGESVTLFAANVDRTGALTAEDSAALAPVIADVAARLTGNAITSSVRAVRKVLGLPQEGN